MQAAVDNTVAEAVDIAAVAETDNFAVPGVVVVSEKFAEQEVFERHPAMFHF